MAKKRTMKPRVCALSTCGREFIPTHHLMTLCSPACRRKRRNEVNLAAKKERAERLGLKPNTGTPVTCANCGEETVTFRAVRDKNYCGKNACINARIRASTAAKHEREERMREAMRVFMAWSPAA